MWSMHRKFVVSGLSMVHFYVEDKDNTSKNYMCVVSITRVAIGMPRLLLPIHMMHTYINTYIHTYIHTYI